MPQSDVCYKVLKAYFGEIFESVNKVSFIYWEGVPVIFQGTEPSPNPLVILNHKPKNQPEIDNFDSVKKSSFGENMDISKKASFGRKGFSKALSLHHQSKNHSEVINFDSVKKTSFGENTNILNETYNEEGGLFEKSIFWEEGLFESIEPSTLIQKSLRSD